MCAGGIIGLGEGEQDRVGLLLQLATLPEHPESVPINRLVAVKGTPLQVRAGGRGGGAGGTGVNWGEEGERGFRGGGHMGARCGGTGEGKG